jgi:hypothetical protein
MLLDLLLAGVDHAQHPRSRKTMELDLQPVEVGRSAHIRIIQYPPRRRR